jgi:hypothetical protein
MRGKTPGNISVIILQCDRGKSHCTSNLFISFHKANKLDKKFFYLLIIKMWFETFIIAALLTITSLAQFSDSTSVVLIEFSESMSIDGLLNPVNYKIVSTANQNFTIHKIGIVSEIDSIIIPDTTLIALVTERLPHKTEFIVSAKNLQDKAGNYLDSTKTVWFFFNGFAPNKFKTPNLRLE